MSTDFSSFIANRKLLAQLSMGVPCILRDLMGEYQACFKVDGRAQQIVFTDLQSGESTDESLVAVSFLDVTLVGIDEGEDAPVAARVETSSGDVFTIIPNSSTISVAEVARALSAMVQRGSVNGERPSPSPSDLLREQGLAQQLLAIREAIEQQHSTLDALVAAVKGLESRFVQSQQQARPSTRPHRHQDPLSTPPESGAPLRDGSTRVSFGTRPATAGGILRPTHTLVAADDTEILGNAREVPSDLTDDDSGVIAPPMVFAPRLTSIPSPTQIQQSTTAVSVASDRLAAPRVREQGRGRANGEGGFGDDIADVVRQESTRQGSYVLTPTTSTAFPQEATDLAEGELDAEHLERLVNVYNDIHGAEESSNSEEEVENYDD